MSNLGARINMAYDFNGTSHLSLPDNSIFDLGIGGTSFSLSCWFYRASNTNAAMFGRGGGQAGWTNTATAHQFVLFIESSVLYLQNYNGAGGFNQITTAAPTSGSWRHFSATYDGTTLKTYKDGAEYASQTRTFYKPTSSNITRIGRSASANTVGASLITDMAIWSTALKSEEITSLYKQFSPHRIRPQNLEFFAPLIRDLQDRCGGLIITNNSATVANHPRIY